MIHQYNLTCGAVPAGVGIALLCGLLVTFPPAALAEQQEETSAEEFRQRFHVLEQRLEPVRHSYQARIVSLSTGPVEISVGGAVTPEEWEEVMTEHFREGSIHFHDGRRRSFLSTYWQREDGESAEGNDRALHTPGDTVIGYTDGHLRRYRGEASDFAETRHAGLSAVSEDIFSYTDGFGQMESRFREHLDFNADQPHRVVREEKDSGQTRYRLYNTTQSEDTPRFEAEFSENGLLSLARLNWAAQGVPARVVALEWDYDGRAPYPQQIILERFNRRGERYLEQVVQVEEFERRTDYPADFFTLAALIEETDFRVEHASIREHRAGEEEPVMLVYSGGQFVPLEDVTAPQAAGLRTSLEQGGRLQDFLLANRVVLSILLLLPLLYLAGRTLVWPAGKRT